MAKTKEQGELKVMLKSRKNKIIKELEKNKKPINKKCWIGDCKPHETPTEDKCDRIVKEKGNFYCSTFYNPDAKWRNGNCNMASHIKKEEDKQSGKKRVGQQKQKKRK